MQAEKPYPLFLSESQIVSEILRIFVKALLCRVVPRPNRGADLHSVLPENEAKRRYITPGILHQKRAFCPFAFRQKLLMPLFDFLSIHNEGAQTHRPVAQWIGSEIV